MDRVAMIRELVPDCAITTDIIVGFPGETEAEFEETLEVVEEVRYDSAFTFIFSPRRGTAAASSTDQRRRTRSKRERMERLVEAVQRIAHRALAALRRPRPMEVLVEGPLAHRPVAAARPHPPQQDGELRGSRRQPGEMAEVEIALGHRAPTLARRASALPFAPRCLTAVAVGAGTGSRCSGPTGVGKTAVALELAGPPARAGRGPGGDRRATRSRSTRASATLTGAATRARSRQRLEHRLVGVRRPSTQTFALGEYMPLAHAEIDAALAAGRRPIVVGGTGLYLRGGAGEPLAGQHAETRTPSCGRLRRVTRRCSSA